MHQLYSESSGNENLNPEEADKLEIGLSRYFALNSFAQCQILLEAAYFNNSLKNLIYRAARTDRYENIEEATLRGYEFRAGIDFQHFLTANISYAHVNTDNTSPELMEELPEHQLSMSVTARTGFGSELHYSFSFFDERTTYLSHIMLADYHVHNLTFAQKLVKQLTLRLRISNLLDKDYQEELGYPAPGRQITAGFSWSR